MPVSPRRDGALDIDHLDRLLREHAGRCALLAVSGASNVTGVVQPIHELAAKVHAVGGRILVDAAQLASHRRIDMRPHEDPGHLDFVVMPAHKMYAPYGTGALVGPRDAFGPEPYDPGGGTVRAVTTDSIAWADLLTGRRRAVRTSSARSRWRRRPASSPGWTSTTSPGTNASSRATPSTA